MNNPPVAVLVLQIVIAIAAVGGSGLALLTFIRQGSWKKREEHVAERTAIKTEIKIVDDEARERVARVEGEMKRVEGKIDIEVRALLARMEAGDGELRNALQGIRSRVDNMQRVVETRLASIEERVAHLPTQESVSAIQAELTGGIARQQGMEKLLDRVARSLDRLEEHHLKP